MMQASLQPSLFTRGLTIRDEFTQDNERIDDVDIAHGEKVEGELDILISRCHKKRVQTEGERKAEEAWRESERRHDQQRRESNRLAWAAYHRQQAERHRSTLTDLVAFHEEAATKLEDNRQGAA